MDEEEAAVVRRAIFEAQDALESLRRFHGAEVSGLCYPALNTVRDAAAVYLCLDAGIEARDPAAKYSDLWRGVGSIFAATAMSRHSNVEE